jgi:RNA polymerase subunit RPABC4/transcription elongation factor Spt4
MGKMLSEEERRHLLEKLNSKMVAIRYMALKFITSSINLDQVDFIKMDLINPEFTKNLVNIVEQICEKDRDEMVKREANVCLEIMKKKLNPALMKDMPVCTSCGERVVISYRFCTKCGVDIKNQNWVSAYKLCEKCKNPVDPQWNVCSYCGNQLIKKIEVEKTCQFCKKNINSSWLMCPYCSSKVKII